MRTIGSNRRGMALPWILGLAVILLVMGLSGSFQVSGVRRVIERIHARRTMDAACASTFEEACARIEASMAVVPPPVHGDTRDLGAKLSWPATIDPAMTRALYATEGVELGTVSVRTSPWHIKMSHGQRHTLIVREGGILELVVDATARAGSTRLKARVMVRRYVHVAPDAAGQLRVRVHSNNLVTEVTE